MERKSREREYGYHGQFGNIVTDPEEVRKTWKQYIQSLYDKDGKPKKADLKFEEEEEEEVDKDEKRPTLLKSEILSAK